MTSKEDWHFRAHTLDECAKRMFVQAEQILIEARYMQRLSVQAKLVAEKIEATENADMATPPLFMPER